MCDIGGSLFYYVVASLALRLRLRISSSSRSLALRSFAYRIILISACYTTSSCILCACLQTHMHFGELVDGKRFLQEVP